MKHLARIFSTLFFLLLLVSSCDKTPKPKVSRGPAPGVTDSQILLGSSLALGGHASFLGTQTLHGALSYLNFINEQGLVT